jgi:hypothetical protein
MKSLLNDSLHYYVDYAFDNKEDNSDNIRTRINEIESHIDKTLDEIENLKKSKTNIMVGSSYRIKDDSIIEILAIVKEFDTEYISNDTCKFYISLDKTKAVALRNCVSSNK